MTLPSDTKLNLPLVQRIEKVTDRSAVAGCLSLMFVGPAPVFEYRRDVVLVSGGGVKGTRVGELELPGVPGISGVVVTVGVVVREVLAEGPVEDVQAVSPSPSATVDRAADTLTTVRDIMTNKYSGLDGRSARCATAILLRGSEESESERDASRGRSNVSE